MSETTVPAGWYADPAGNRGQRWWDGLRWTGHVLPAAVVSAYPEPFGMSIAPQPLPERNRTWGFSGPNPAAFLALILGLAGLVANPLLLPSAGALIWGVVGVRRASGPATGRAMAVSGIVLGLVGLAAFYSGLIVVQLGH
ncbi:DUF2510 domain-containing protein [Actinoplanes sp. GCM10030250]|uniref:DUF2510 domain-containing protein n=1 Tax=Actinoplanes sp. GCM10030250 TaxID=3273376 RepID=UPI00360F6DC8